MDYFRLIFGDFFARLIERYNDIVNVNVIKLN
jgi:hypothetical protein